MIVEFVQAWEARKGEVRKRFSAGHPEQYIDVVRAVVSILDDSIVWSSPDVERIHQIDDGDYQGTLVFVIGSAGYQPSDYWYVMVSYGSCSGCDTLEAIRNYSSELPTADELDQYMTLALHIVQRLKKMGDDE
jgi:hypothetical protein